MKLVYKNMEKHINFVENTAYVVIVENKKYFRDMILQMQQAMLGADSNWVLSTNGKEIKLDKYTELILDPINLDCNTRKLLTNLYNEMEKEALGSEHFVQTAFVKSEILKFVNDMIQEVDYPFLNTDDFTFADLFKAVNVHFDTQNGDFLERLLNYVQVCARFQKKELFVFVNLKTYLTSEEIKAFYRDLFYKKIYVLLLENQESEPLEYEKTLIIDEDLCLVKA